MSDTTNWARTVDTLDLAFLILKFIGALIVVVMIAAIPFALVRIVVAVVQARN